MIYEIFPFLESFPFKEYVLSNGKSSEKYKDLLNKEDEDEELINFQYTSMDKDITVSFYEEDMEFLNIISRNISKLDSLRKEIDKGLKSDDILVKFESIRKSKAFLKKVKSPAEKENIFRSVLDGFQEINEINLSEGIIGKINKLDDKLANYRFTVNELMAVEAYLNFQLHHVKIILGVVIASKIH